jgi:ribose transport system ATP-binding protein
MLEVLALSMQAKIKVECYATYFMPPDQQFLRPLEGRTPVANQAIKSPILAAQGVTKAFGPVTVLHGIHIDFQAGEIHAIVGENGAGKSTLMKILAGVIKPSLGEVLYEGKPVETGNLRRMENFGIKLIHQELNLAEDLSVVENLFLGEEWTWGPFLDEGKMRAKGREVLAKVGLEVDLDAPGSQSAGQ